MLDVLPGRDVEPLASWLAGHPEIEVICRGAQSLEELLLKAAHRTSKLDPCRPYLHQRWREGRHDVPRLHHEIQEQGFTGDVQSGRRYAPFKKPHSPLPKSPPAPPPPVRAVPKPRRVVRWTMSAEADATELREFRTGCPHLDLTVRHVRDFAAMLRDQNAEALPAWMDRVKADDLSALHSLANGFHRDLDAVTAAFATPWNSVQVEGHATRAKLLKRTGFGRAHLPLLRKRILHSP
ncbi:transposase [Streptomyces sp. NPDC007971]|uniref:transposase n=1 Tax=Streptomyces sp. NPDC007971 TaxID=3364799 RepID=UPI0036ECEBD3